MFTKKTDSSESVSKLGGERSGGSKDTGSSPFTERPSSQAKPQGPSASKMMPSIIGEDLTVTGNVSSKGEIQVDGQLTGDLICGSLLLGDKAEINGSVTAEDVVVRGKVMGSIRGLRVTLQAQSHVEGDVYHQSLAIEQGAYFEGKSRRSDDPMASAPTATTNPNPTVPPAPDKPFSSNAAE